MTQHSRRCRRSRPQDLVLAVVAAIGIAVPATAAAYHTYAEMPEWYKTPAHAHLCGNADPNAYPSAAVTGAHGDGRVTFLDLYVFYQWAGWCEGTADYCRVYLTHPSPVFDWLRRMDVDNDDYLTNWDAALMQWHNGICYPTDDNPADVDRDGDIDQADVDEVADMVARCATPAWPCENYLMGLDATGAPVKPYYYDPTFTARPGSWILGFCDVDRDGDCDPEDTALVQSLADLAPDVDAIATMGHRTVTGYKKMLVIVPQWADASAPFFSPATAYQLADKGRAGIEMNAQGRLVLDIGPQAYVLDMPKNKAAYIGQVAPKHQDFSNRFAQDAAVELANIGIDHEDYDYVFVLCENMWGGAFSNAGFSDQRHWFYLKKTQYEGWVVQHEATHTFGFAHAEMSDCTSPSDPFCFSNLHGPGGDSLDPMGYIVGSHPTALSTELRMSNPAVAMRAGWYGPGDAVVEGIVRVTALSKTYDLAPLGQPAGPGQVHGLRIYAGLGTDAWVYVRDDANMASPNPEVFVSLSAKYGDYTNYMVDWTANSRSGETNQWDATDAFLPEGALLDHWSTSGGGSGIQVKPLSVSSSGVTVEVNLEPGSPATQWEEAPRVMWLDPQGIRGAVGQNHDFRFKVFDPDAATGNGSGIARVDVYWDPIKSLSGVTPKMSLQAPQFDPDQFTFSIDQSIAPTDDVYYFRVDVFADDDDDGAACVSDSDCSTPGEKCAQSLCRLGLSHWELIRVDDTPGL